MTQLTLLLLLSTSPLAQSPFPPVRESVQPAKKDMVLKWNEIALQAIRADRSPPPVAARGLAIMHLAMYDAVMAIERTHRPYLVNAEAAPGTSAEAAVSAAAQRVLVALYPKQRETFDLLLARCLVDIPNVAARDRGVALGQFMAEQMLDSRRDDGADQAAARFAFKETPGSWRPTAPKYQEALLPDWGYVKPFAIRKGTQHRPAGPPPLSSRAYAIAFDEVKRLGGTNSTLRTEEQTEIAHFWADDLGTVTPPGHWNRIAQTIAQEKGGTLAENARIFAHLNISLADASILCWVIKFSFDFWRPITAIREAEGNNSWTPILPTPPFPAYTSGHSTFSAAGAASLARSFGTDEIHFITTSDALPGVRRSFKSLWAAAEEAGMSRIYGGIHWSFDNTDGLRVGRTLGDYVSNNTLQPIRQQVLRP